MVWFGVAEGREDCRQHRGQKGPQVGEDLAEVVAAGSVPPDGVGGRARSLGRSAARGRG